MSLKYKILGLVLIALALVSAPRLVFAQNKFSANETSVISADEVVEGDYFAAGDRVQIDGTVKGDAYIAGGNVIVTGKVEGDILAAGGNVKIQGEVGHDIRVAGGQVNIDATVPGSVTVFAGNVDISKETTIAGGLVTGAGNVYLDGTVGKNVEAAVGVLSLGSNAKVGGDITYASDENADIATQASVSGQVTKRDLPKTEAPTREAVNNFFMGLDFASKVISIVTTLLVGLLLIHFFPKFTESTSDLVTKSFGKSLLIGLVTLIVSPVLFVILLFTIVGIPISFVFAFALFIMMYLGRIYVLVALGAKALELVNKNSKQTLNTSFLVGALVYYVLTLIPIVAGLTKLAVVIAGLGAILVGKRDFYLAARKAKLL